ncbi:hypothetical protein [Sinomonas mesophila]|uniref:hypothetical protein n=1 Tax=Sinomonas mesophila TaxID=1531955 RepID=UPI0011157010|nr:hypothetical protein [Sinomonas mesophila]
MRSRRLARQHWVDYRERNAATAVRGLHSPGTREAVVVITSASEAGYVGTAPGWAVEDGHSAFGPECH